MKRILSKEMLPKELLPKEMLLEKMLPEEEVSEADWQWERFDFNQEYQGYYPHCQFTAVAWTKSGFLAAGVEKASKSGLLECLEDDFADSSKRALFSPVVYSSLTGGVWQPENLTALTPKGSLSPTQPIFAICPDTVSGQIFLLGGKGQVITLTGCPNCVKISHFTDQDIIKGELTEGLLKMTLADGSTAKIHRDAALQLSLSREAAEEKRRQGGIWIYVGAGDDGLEGTGVVICPLSKINALLQAYPKEQLLVFFCESGTKAEAAAKAARAQGFEQAYFFIRK